MSFHFSYPNGRHNVPAWVCLAVVVGCTAEASDNDRVAPTPSPKPAALIAREAEAEAEYARREAERREAEQRAAEGHHEVEVANNDVAVTELTAPPFAAARSGGTGPLEFAGDLRPEQSADLSFKIGGMLAAVRATRGEYVKRGQVLAGLSDAEARAQFASAEAAVVQARAQLDLARDNEVRTRSLVDSKAAPGSQATISRLQSAIAEGALLQANAARELAQAAWFNHTLKAPFDGELVKVPDGVGQIVQPGTPLFRIESLDILVLRTTVSESDVHRVRVGDPVVIEAQGQKFQGRVRLVLRSLEAASRRAPVEIEVPNPKRALIAGSYVRATLRGSGSH